MLRFKWIFLYLKVLLGIIIEFIIFFPLIIFVRLFRTTKPLINRSEKIKNILQNLNANSRFENLSKVKKFAKKSQNIKFPWFFKIILYAISFFSMGISIAFVLFKGKKILIYI